MQPNNIQRPDNTKWPHYLHITHWQRCYWKSSLPLAWDSPNPSSYILLLPLAEHFQPPEITDAVHPPYHFTIQMNESSTLKTEAVCLSETSECSITTTVQKPKDCHLINNGYENLFIYLFSSSILNMITYNEESILSLKVKEKAMYEKGELVLMDRPLYGCSDLQGEHKVFPWLQTFITRKLLYVEYKHFFFSKCNSRSFFYNTLVHFNMCSFCCMKNE